MNTLHIVTTAIGVALVAFAVTAIVLVLADSGWHKGNYPEHLRNHRVSRSEDLTRRGSLRLPYGEWLDREAVRASFKEVRVHEASQAALLVPTVEMRLLGPDEVDWLDEEALNEATEAFHLDPLTSWVDPSLVGADEEECTLALEVFDALAEKGDITVLGALGSRVPAELPHWGTEDDEAFRAFAESLEMAASAA